MELEEAQKKCQECLIWAFGALKAQASTTQLNAIADLISQTMTGPWRYFHTPEHIFEVGGTQYPIEVQDPIEILAALFHDLVYVQVDQGISLNIGSYITPFVKEVGGHIVIRELYELPEDPIFRIVLAVFGFKLGQTLSPFAGQNEFLSAVIAGKCLEPFLAPNIIAQIAACIEATVPFRPKLESGLTAMDLLYQRLISANSQFNFEWSDEQIHNVVKRSVRLANRDVRNFAYSTSAEFLDNTWNLLPETNHELINANSYTVHGYRKSLQKMEGFMNFLKPEVVFQRFMGEPSEDVYQEMLEKTKKNLELAKLYLGTKLTAVAILEALSYRMGHDIPISTMMGELPNKRINVAALENFIPDIPEGVQPKTELENEVLELLSKGRGRESAYDLKNSPITTFIIKYLGFDSVRYLLERAKEFFKGSLEAEDFLRECDPEVVRTVTAAVEKLFDSRKIALRGNG